jgi:hypothetical protein
MKKIILHISFLFLSILSFGQTQLLKDFDFEKGGYYLLGTFSESDRNSLQDSLGEFYTDNISILNQFKEEWTFTEPGKKYACGYHYSVYLCRNGIALKQISINLNCNEIVTDEGYFYFDSQKLRMFYGKLITPIEQRKSFIEISKARNYRTEILKDSNLIMTPVPNWTTHEGTFQFEYICKEGSKDCNYENSEKTLLNIQKIIHDQYPNEKFDLDDRGGSSMTMIVEVSCNKTLSDKFELFKRDTESYFGKFTPYHLGIRTYWKKK